MDKKDDVLFDAIIVGAGPSGSSCSLFLARAGRRVLLIDKAKFPREKVCGDAVSGKSIAILRELKLLRELQEPVHSKIIGVLMGAPCNKQVIVPFPKAEGLDCAGYCLRRIQSDNVMFDAVQREKNITLIQQFLLKELLFDKNGAVQGIVGEYEGKEEKYYAKVIVGADGSGSAVARKVGLPPVPSQHLYMGIRGYWRGVEGLGENIELFFIDEVLPGYLWVFPMGDGTANVGLGILAQDMKKRKLHPNKILLNAIENSPMLKQRFAKAKLEGNIGAWTIPLGSYKRKLCGEGWMLVGDAASLVDPFSGEGFGNAAASGKFAALAIDLAIAQNADVKVLGKEMLLQYVKDVQEKLYPEMDISYKLQRATRIKFFLNHFISKAADKPKFRQVLIDMLANNEDKKKVEDPLFYLKLLLP